jgi:hypothetical protein
MFTDRCKQPPQMLELRCASLSMMTGLEERMSRMQGVLVDWAGSVSWLN